MFRDPELQFVMAKHEGDAAAMADGYARATGRLGICAVITGPGALNVVTHVGVAQTDDSVRDRSR